MDRNDAVTIVAMICHGWPGAVWEAERMESYVQDLMPLDAALTTHALARARSTLKYRPSIAELREFYAIERRKQDMAQSDRLREQLDQIPDSGPIPPWVKRWLVARWLVAPPDLRPMKEQFPLGLPEGETEWLPDDLYVEEAARVTDAQVWATMSRGAKILQAEDDGAIVTA